VFEIAQRGGRSESFAHFRICSHVVVLEDGRKTDRLRATHHKSWENKNMTAGLPRRNFLKAVGAMSAAGAVPALAAGGDVALLVDPAIAAPPIAWATDKLRNALSQKGAKLNVVNSRAQARSALVIVVAGPQSALAQDFTPPVPGWGGTDSVRLVPGASALLVSAQDVRGFVYGLLELAERVRGRARDLRSGFQCDAVQPAVLRGLEARLITGDNNGTGQARIRLGDRCCGGGAFGGNGRRGGGARQDPADHVAPRRQARLPSQPE
jgi:hypothetical protein